MVYERDMEMWGNDVYVCQSLSGTGDIATPPPPPPSVRLSVCPSHLVFTLLLDNALMYFLETLQAPFFGVQINRKNFRGGGGGGWGCPIF